MSKRDSLKAWLFMVLVLPYPIQAGLPEFSFCPIGGPPGWFNRMTGQHDHDWRYSYPPPYPYPNYITPNESVPVFYYPLIDYQGQGRTQR